MLTFSPSVKIKAGVWYLDRNRRQDPARRRHLLDAQPRRLLRHPLSQPEDRQAADDLGQHRVVALRLGRLRRRQVGDHAATPALRAPTDGEHDTFDYNDIRVAVGLEFNTLRQLHGMFEVGGAFDRELRLPERYAATLSRPNNTVFLRAGLAY